MRFTFFSVVILAILVGCGGGREAADLPLQPLQPGGAPLMSVAVHAPNPAGFVVHAGPVEVLDDVRWKFDFEPLQFGGPLDGVFPVTHEVLSDRSVVVAPEKAIPAGRGGFAAQAQYGIFAGHAAADDPQLTIMFQQDPIEDAAQTDGRYHFVSLGRVRNGAITTAARATLVAGLMALTDGVVNIAGNVLVMVPRDLPTSLSVFGDLIVDPTGLHLVGGASLDGNVIVVGGSSESVGPSQIQALIRESTAASTQALSGTYWIVGIGDGDPWISATGTANFDGAGAGTVQWEFTDGTTADTDQFEVSYDVAPDGGVTAGLGFQTPALSLRGGVSPDGRVAVLGGALDPDSIPMMVVLVRKD